MKFARRVACCVLMSGAMVAWAGSSVPVDLQQLKGKIVFLRNMEAGGKLSFDAQGNQLGTHVPGAFGYSAIKVEKVKASRTEVKIDGQRLALIYYIKPSSPQHRDVRYFPLEDDVRIKIARDPSQPQALDVALKRIFALNALEELRSMTPKDEVEALATLASLEAPQAGSDADYLKNKKMEIVAPGFEHVNSKDITQPRLIHSVEPDFTDRARRKKISGICILGVIVGTDGRPTRIWVTQAVDPGLGYEAVKAVTQYRFIPAKYHGQPVPVLIYVEVNFRIY